MFTVTIDHVSRTPSLWCRKVEQTLERFPDPFVCDEILVFNGTSIHDVLGDWCDVLSFNLSSEGMVILIIFASCDSAANRPHEQR